MCSYKLCVLLITALIVGFSPAQYTILEGEEVALLNVNVNGQFEAESVVLQASLINGTATSKRWIVVKSA